MKTYSQLPSWNNYKALVARRFGISILREPKESSMPIRGHDIHLDTWEPDAPPRGTIVLVHGGGGHGRILAPLGDAVAALGWRAIAPDLPGYGLSTPAPGFRWEYEEWPAVVAEVANRVSGPVVLFGLSVGGLTAALAATRARSVAGVIATTLLDMGDRAIFARSARWKWLGHASIVGFSALPSILDRVALPLWLAAPLDKMSRDVEVAAYFRRDPLLGRLKVPTRFFRTLHACKVGALALPCPLLLVHPGADDWTPTALSQAVFDRIETPKTFRELSNGSHLPLEQPAYKELMAAVEEWLKPLSETEQMKAPAKAWGQHAVSDITPS